MSKTKEYYHNEIVGEIQGHNQLLENAEDYAYQYQQYLIGLEDASINKRAEEMKDSEMPNFLF